MAQMAQKLMEALSKKGGGAPPGGSPPPTDEKKDDEKNAYDNVLASIFGDDASTTDDDAGRTESILDAISDNFGDSSITTEVRELVEGIAEVSAQVSIQNAATEVTPIEEEPVQTPVSQPVGTEELNRDGFSGSNILGNSGVGAFFGYVSNAIESAADASRRFVTGVCTNRPWDNPVISNIFSTGFFDNLCVSRGYVAPPVRSEKQVAQPVGKASLTCPTSAPKDTPFTIAWSCPVGYQSGGVGFTTDGLNSGSKSISAASTQEYELQCADSSRARCTVEIGVPKVDLTASPASVQLGGRARLYWTSESVTSCELTGLGMRQVGLSGAAMSPAIYDRTVFTATCTTPFDSDGDGELDTVSDRTIVEIGL